jgi:hypothetical protein
MTAERGYQTPTIVHSNRAASVGKLAIWYGKTKADQWRRRLENWLVDIAHVASILSCPVKDPTVCEKLRGRL